MATATDCPDTRVSAPTGDTIKRHLEFLGHEVLGLNHVGDWGTQFGMLITYMRKVVPEALTEDGQVDLGDLVVLYKAAKKAFDEGLGAPPSKFGAMSCVTTQQCASAYYSLPCVAAPLSWWSPVLCNLSTPYINDSCTRSIREI